MQIPRGCGILFLQKEVCALQYGETVLGRFLFRPNRFIAYVEIDGNVDSENGKKMLSELSGMCDKLKVAGRFAPHTEI